MSLSRKPETTLKSIEVRFDANGHIYATAHSGWTITDYPQQCTQCLTFSRGNYRIKVAVYGGQIEHLDTFGAYLAAALVDENFNPVVWRTVELNELR